jgi:hypothetical protein
VVDSADAVWRYIHYPVSVFEERSATSARIAQFKPGDSVQAIPDATAHWQLVLNVDGNASGYVPSASLRTVPLSTDSTVPRGTSPVVTAIESSIDPAQRAQSSSRVDALLDSAEAYLSGRGGDGCAWKTVWFLDSAAEPLSSTQRSRRAEIEERQTAKINSNPSRYGDNCR